MNAASAAVPAAHALSEQVVSLPMHAFLDDQDVARVTTALSAALG